jgi:GR25 family glycosyltransferase involved in LPS biosynthesis
MIYKPPFPIFVISLARATARREHIRSLFARYSLDYTLVDAVDKLTLPQTVIDGIWDNNVAKMALHGRKLTVGEIACTMSHIKAWSMIQGMGLDYAFTMEDDVRFDERFVKVISSELSVPDDCDVINFHTDCWQMGAPIPLTDGITVSKADYVNRNTCLLVGKRGVNNLLERSFPISAAADDFVGHSHVGGCVTYIARPQIVCDTGSESEIGHR